MTIDDIEPYSAAKGNPSGFLDPKQLQELANRLQVTTLDKTKTFDLESCVTLSSDDDNAAGGETQMERPAFFCRPDRKLTSVSGELLATESLLDPQLFVSTEHVCATVDKQRDCVMHKYMKTTQQGHFVIHTQSAKFQRRDMVSGKRSRRILGIYAEFAGIDYLEALRLLNMSQMNKLPSKIDKNALFASFGPNTMFTLLPHKDWENNPKILKAIYEQL